MKKQYELSLSSKIINGLFFGLFNITKKSLLEKQMPHASKKHYVPKKGYLQSVHSGVTVYSLFHPNSKRHLLFFHGGAYVLKGQSFHFSLLQKIYKHASCSVHYIDYPMPPECTVIDTISSVQKAVISLCKEHHIESVSLMGDSAGAGLALSLATVLSTDISIEQVFLLSPWLDLTMKHPFPTTDPILSVEGLKKAANMYAPQDTSHPYASPLLVSELPQIPLIVFSSTGDILHNDALRLHDRYPQNVNLHIVTKALHDFALFPFTKEQKMVLSIVKDAMKS
jgi:acetyl esterase/lipase